MFEALRFLLRRFPLLSGTAGILLIVMLAYWPALHGQFVWDDLLLVDKNPLVTGKLNLATIWFRTDFPLSMVALWLEWFVSGKHASGYHLVNVLLHALGALLFWRVLVKLQSRGIGETGYPSERELRREGSDAPTLQRPSTPALQRFNTFKMGAWFAAVLFAVHPVAAASVVWISELKNTLSLPFYLLGIWCFLRFEEEATLVGAEVTRLSPAGLGGAERIGASLLRLLRGLLRLRGENARPDPPPHPPTFDFGAASVGGYKPIRMYVFALLAFVLALLSKTSTVMLPAVLLLCVWWRRKGARTALSARPENTSTRGQGCPRSLQLRNLVRVSPFFAVAMVFGLLTIWFQRQAIGAIEVQSENFWARLAGAGRAIWFYLSKAVLPIRLNFIYPRWNVDPKAPVSWIPLLLLIAMFGICWYLRRSWGRAMLFALGCFVLNLLPVLGFVDMYYLALSRVSDHFAYLALLPVTALIGGGLAWLAARSGRGVLRENPPEGYEGQRSKMGQHKSSGDAVERIPTNRQKVEVGSVGVSPASIAREGPEHADERPALPGLAFVAISMALAFAVLTFQRARIIANDETLWRDTLAKNPAAWTARNNLGCILAEQGKYDAAIEQFVAGLRTNPRNPEAHCNLGRAMAAKGRFDEAETHFREALAIRPENPDIQSSYASALAQQGKAEAALPHFREALRLEPDFNTRLQFASLLYQTRHPAEAVAQYRLALAQKPDHAEALNNLAWLLATSADASVRNGREAVQLAERACSLGGQNNPMPLGTLAAAYAEAGRFKEAVETAQKASEIAARNGNSQFAQMNQQLLKYYRAGKAFHEPPN